MANLIRWSPMRDILRWDRGLDEFFGDLMGPLEVGDESSCVCPRVESFRRNGSYVVRVDLPGVNPKDVHLTAENGCLTIEGERKREEGIEESSVLHDEFCYGAFKRSMAIPEGVKAEEIKARYHDGILEITAPMEEHYLPKRIEVEVQKS
jgi:HSP20 family protein